MGNHLGVNDMRKMAKFDNSVVMKNGWLWFTFLCHAFMGRGDEIEAQEIYVYY